MTEKRYIRLLRLRLGITQNAWVIKFRYSTDAIQHYPFNDNRLNNRINGWLLRDYNPVTCGGEQFQRMRNYRRILTLEALRPYKHIFELREL